MDKLEKTGPTKWTRQEFEIEATLRLISTYAAKDGINPAEAAQHMAQTITDALHRRGVFGDPTEVQESVKSSGITRYVAPRPRSRNQGQMQQEAVIVEEQY